MSLANGNSGISFGEALQRSDLAHWQDLQKRIGNFTTACLIVEFFEAQPPEFRARNMGAYLRARETVQRQHHRHAKRVRRVNAAVRCVKAVFDASTYVVRVIGKRVVYGFSVLPPAATVSAATDKKVVAKPDSYISWPDLIDPTVVRQTSC